ncbi:MAG: ABC-2 transporter permease [Firmicutes bacterium]|nr:ABC-2 transporter permease [Bacillota bacterium]MDY6160721.1 ABC-2 transporter permease [Candidatus Faecousia sp.]
MKGLLLKDFYMTVKYCRTYLLIGIVFIAVSFAGADSQNMFFVFYPCLLCGMIPVNLLAYDERSRWLEYSGTLPYTKAQLVSAKYLVGVIVQGVMLLAVGIAQAVRMNLAGSFRLGEYGMMMALIFAMATITSSISLPFMFRWGVEKGRIAYYCMIGFVCAAGYLGSVFFTESRKVTAAGSLVPWAMILLGTAIYAASWLVSIALYQKREVA